MTRAAAVSLVLGLVALAPHQTPVRDGGAASTAPAGTAAIGGVVVTDELPTRPLRRAVVTLNASDGTVARTTITADDGRFAFTALPAGRFSLVASKGAYVTTYYGGRKPGRPPAVPIALAAGEARTNLVMKMLRGGVITGRVVEPNGGALPLATVIVNEVRGTGADRIALTAPPDGRWNVYADERGSYRVYGLAPGEYVVSVAPSRFFGGGADIRATAASDLQRALLAVGQASAGAPMRTAAPPAAPRPDVPVMNYAAVFYPGTTDFGAAGIVSVGPAEVRSDVDLPVMLVRMSSVSGTVVSGDGRALGETMVTLSNPSPQGSSNQGMGLGAGGSFAFRGLAPGTYSMLVRGLSKVEPGAPATTLWASTDLAIDGNDIKDLTLALQPGANLSGRIVFDGTAPKPEMSRVRVNLDAQSTAARSFGLASPPAPPDANGAFSFASVGPGAYRLTATIQNPGATPAWTVRSALIDGRDVSDAPVDIPPGATIANAVITMTDRITELSGVFRDAAGAPTSDYAVLVFSTDRRQWRKGSRRFAGPIRPGTDGRFTVRDLPPGEYFLAASMDLDAAEIYSAPVLDELAANAIRVTLAEGEKKTQDLQVSRWW